MIVVDSDVLIDALRGRDPSASRVLAGLAEGSLATTSVSAFELLSGARTAEQMQAVTDLLAGLAILPFDERAGRAAAACRRDLETRRQTIGMADFLIAGICLSRSAALLTRNRKHFARVPELLLAEL